MKLGSEASADTLSAEVSQYLPFIIQDDNLIFIEFYL